MAYTLWLGKKKKPTIELHDSGNNIMIHPFNPGGGASQPTDSEVLLDKVSISGPLAFSQHESCYTSLEIFPQLFQARELSSIKHYSYP